MDFKQIEAFVNVIKYKGFSKAAEATFLTQPTISAHVNALEKELQLQLIDRTKKEALPTAEGKLFYNYALTMLNTREQAIYSLQNFSLNINGTIGIQSSSIPGEYIVPGLIADFKKEYGKAKFYLEQSDSSLVADNIKAHKGEIGFTGHKENDGLTYKLLMKDKAVLITPQVPHFKEREGERLQLKDFIGEPFSLRERGSATRETFERGTGRQRHPPHFHECGRQHEQHGSNQTGGERRHGRIHHFRSGGGPSEGGQRVSGIRSGRL